MDKVGHMSSKSEKIVFEAYMQWLDFALLSADSKKMQDDVSSVSEANDTSAAENSSPTEVHEKLNVTEGLNDMSLEESSSALPQQLESLDDMPDIPTSVEELATPCPNHQCGKKGQQHEDGEALLRCS